MTGYQSKRAMARDKLIELAKEGMGMHSPDAPEYIVCEALIEALAQPAQEPKSVTYKEAQDSMNALEKGNLRQQVIAEELGQRKLYTAPPAQPEQEPWRESASDYERGVIDGRQKQAQSSVDKAVNRMAQRPWVGLTESEWFNWWRVSQVANETEAEIDFADFLIIAQAVVAKLKELNNG